MPDKHGCQLVLNPRCHRKAPVRVLGDSEASCVQVVCSVCGELVVELALAKPLPKIECEECREAREKLQ